MVQTRPFLHASRFTLVGDAPQTIAHTAPTSTLDRSLSHSYPSRLIQHGLPKRPVCPPAFSPSWMRIRIPIIPPLLLLSLPLICRFCFVKQLLLGYLSLSSSLLSLSYNISLHSIANPRSSPPSLALSLPHVSNTSRPYQDYDFYTSGAGLPTVILTDSLFFLGLTSNP